MYCGINRVPEAFEVGNGDMLTYSATSAFWAFNFVSNFCYLRYDLMTAGCVKRFNPNWRQNSSVIQDAIDKAALELYNNRSGAGQGISDRLFGKCGAKTLKRWKELGQLPPGQIH